MCGEDAEVGSTDYSEPWSFMQTCGQRSRAWTDRSLKTERLTLEAVWDQSALIEGKFFVTLSCHNPGTTSLQEVYSLLSRQ